MNKAPYTILVFILSLFLVQCTNDKVETNGGIIISSPPIVVFPGERFEYKIKLNEDFKVDAILGQWPDWMCLKEEFHMLKGKPEVEHEGNHNIRLRVQSNGKVYEQAWVLTVASRPKIELPAPWETGNTYIDFLNNPLSNNLRDWTGTLFSEKPVMEDDVIITQKSGRIIEVQILEGQNNGSSCFIILECEDNTRTLFTAVDPEYIFVKEGQYVTSGSKIARTTDPLNFSPVSWHVNSIERVFP